MTEFITQTANTTLAFKASDLTISHREFGLDTTFHLDEYWQSLDGKHQCLESHDIR